MWSRLFNLITKKKNSGDTTSIFNFGKNKLLLIVLSSVLPVFIAIIVIIITIFGPILMAKQYVDDLKNDVAVFFDKVGNVLTLKGWCSDQDGSCEKKAEQKYYERLEEVYTKYSEDGVEIDVELITATIFYGSMLSDDKFQTTEDSTDPSKIEYGDVHLSDINKLASEMVSSNKLDYSRYRKYLVDKYIENRFDNLYETDDQKERIADEIMSFASFQYESGGTTNIGGQTYYGSCSYNVAGTTIDTSNLEVVILGCDGQTELERVDFEKYIKGVVYGEIGSSWSPEVLKTQAIAARSFTLTRNEGKCPGRPNNCEYGYNPNTNEIRMRNCEADQVYCDYEKGCQKYLNNGYVSLISGVNNPSLEVHKWPLTGDDKNEFENELNKVTGKVLQQSDGKIYQAAFINNDQYAWNNMYLADNSLDANEILVKYYWNKTGHDLTIVGNCSVSSGEYANWKQSDPNWASVPIGNKTLESDGCLVTSISIQLARSGTVNLPTFNPGIFANELSNRGAFPPTSALLQWAPLRTTLDELSNGKFVAVSLDTELSGTKTNKINQLQNYINQGNLLVLSVINEGHWVAIDRIENGEVYIFDPGASNVNTISQKYDWEGVTSVKIFKVSQ